MKASCTNAFMSLLFPERKQVIYDIGGGIGVYSAWLAEQGHEVHQIENDTSVMGMSPHFMAIGKK
jgi:protein-L-isoaspartate O-methyltransferase